MIVIALIATLTVRVNYNCNMVIVPTIINYDRSTFIVEATDEKH
jgi:hypothetical protein